MLNSLQTPGVPALHDASVLHRQLPSTQDMPGAHARPHAPQFAASDRGLTHPTGGAQHSWPVAHPPAALHAHTIVFTCATQCSPGLHALVAFNEHRHTPAAVQETEGDVELCPHCAPFVQPQRGALPEVRHVNAEIPCLEQSLSHPPHCFWVVTDVSHPLSIAGPEGFVQLPRPESHADTHSPLVHVIDVTPVPEHARPHPPQFHTSDATGSSHPSLGLPLQSP